MKTIIKKMDDTGSILITILVMMVILSLGVGVALMNSSSSIQTAENNIELRATNLAEAGFRYAGGEYAGAGDLADKLARLEALNEEEVTLLNNNGSFKLKVFPFFFITNATGAFTTLNMRVPGKFPDGFQSALAAFEASADVDPMVNIADKFYEYSSGTATPGATDDESDQFSISLTTSEAVSVDRNTGVYLAFAPASSISVSEGGSFIVFSDTTLSNLLPVRNGLIDLYLDEGSFSGTYSYRRKENTESGVLLSGIQAVEDGALPLSLDTNSRIVIKKQARIESVGTTGTGSLQSSRDLDISVYLTDEEFVAPDESSDLDLGQGNNTAETFSDEGHTKLDNWEFESTSPRTDEEDLITTTTQEVTVEISGTEVTSDNFLTFQNFSSEDQDAGYTMEIIEKDRLPASVRGKNLNGLWGNASDNIYFVGDDGTIIYYNGTDFTLVDVGTVSQGKNLNAIWGLPSERDADTTELDHIFVGGDDGIGLINEGNGWRAASYIRRWYQSSRNFNRWKQYDIYAANGTAWRGMDGASSNHFDGYGQGGTNPFNWDNRDASELYISSLYFDDFDEKVNFRCLWAKDLSTTSQGTDYHNVIVGEFSESDRGWRPEFEAGDGLILHEFYNYAVISGCKLRGVWGSGWGDIYAVGDDAKIYHNTYNSYNSNWTHRWNQVNPGDIPTTENLNGVYGNSATDFYVVGDNATILYNKGDGFKLVSYADDEFADYQNGPPDLNNIWGSDQTGIYAVGDEGTIVFLGFPTNQIGEYILPLDKNAEISAKWAATPADSTPHYLSYTIQVKHVWGDELAYAASGICFRWHRETVTESNESKYAGYGISFLKFDSSDNDTNDMIPDSMKPYFNGTKEQNDRLLIVLWEQYVQDGAEKRRWIAYKDISTDSDMVKNGNGGPVDLSTLMVRVHEKTVEGRKVNDINVYYANPSTADETSDNLYNNTIRYRLNSTSIVGQGQGHAHGGTPISTDDVIWPVFDVDTWTGCSGSSCNDIDRFTLVDNVSVAEAPEAATTAMKYWIVNPAADIVLQSNGYTMRAGRFTSPSGTEFGTQEERSEIAVHVFGNIGEYGSQTLVSFTDFAVSLGVDADGVDTESSFGGLQ